MQNRIDKKFSELKEVNKKALVAFVTSGDPNQKISKNILNVLRDQKIDLVEIGFPFSDPMADGPTIQKSSQRAIKAGANIDSTLQLVKDFRKNDKNIPIAVSAEQNLDQFNSSRLLEKSFKRTISRLYELTSVVKN